jgi:hypothetical protein
LFAARNIERNSVEFCAPFVALRPRFLGLITYYFAPTQMVLHSSLWHPVFGAKRKPLCRMGLTLTPPAGRTAKLFKSRERRDYAHRSAISRFKTTRSTMTGQVPLFTQRTAVTVDQAVA